MSASRPTSATKNQLIELVLVALGSSHGGLKALRGVLGSDPRLAVLGSAVELQPVWEVLEAQPDFSREAAVAALCFVKGHEQGLLQRRRPLPTGKTIHGLVCGSAYLHSEDYRGPQRNNEWRGTVVLHDVRNGGDCDPMPLTLQYMAREYGGVELHDLLATKYPDIPRGWAA
jgi:hypothetical protein